MKSLLNATLGFLVVGVCLSQAQTITGFGDTADFTMIYSDFDLALPADVKGSGNYTISGVDSGQTLWGELQSAQFIGTGLALETIHLNLVGSIIQNPATDFQIELFDADGDSVLYEGNWSGFNVGSSVLLSFGQETGSFNGTAVQLGLNTAGSGSSLNFTFDNLSAQPIPEPSTYMALTSFGILGYTLVRRRRSKTRATA